MWRDCVALVAAFAVTVFGLSPQLSAQEQYPSQEQYPIQQVDPNAGYGQAPQQYPEGGWPSGGASQPPQQGGAGDAIDPALSAQHGVARLSMVQGDVNIKRADTGELVAAAANAPVVASDRVQTGGGSRAEIELDYANIVRLGPDTDVGFAILERHRFQLQLGAGTLISRVIRNGGSNVEIDTPSIGVHPAAEGVYRISVGQDGTTRIAVRIGTAEVYSPRGTEQLSAGQTMLVRGDPANPEFSTGTPIEQDQFEDWSINRDRTLLQSQSYQHVNPEIEGAGDLDAYGSWVPSQYGQVWAPRPPSPDWSPYSDGHWAYVDNYYGWSWVGNEPWGWAPYHYGRWFWNGGYGWSWWPGQADASVFWSPALVGFFGFGLGLAAGIGWAALAPFEICHPWWGHGYGFGHGGYGFGGYRGNGAGLYHNAAFRGGALTASYGQFGSHFGRFSFATREQLSGASALRGGIPVRPTQASYRFSNRQAVGNTRLSAAAGRSYFRQSGGSGRSYLRGGSGFTAGRVGGNSGFNNRGFTREVQHGVPPNMSGRGGAGTGGWQRFGNTGSSSYRQNFSGSNGSQQGGWHTFGRPEASGRQAFGQSYNSGKSGGNSQQLQPYGGRSYGGGSYGGGQQSFGRNPSYAQPPRGGQSYGGNAYRGAPGPSLGATPRYNNTQPSFGSSRGNGGSSPYRGFSGGGGGSYHGGGGGGGHSGGGAGRSGGGGGGHRR